MERQPLMSSFLVTLDTGTTNTRVVLWNAAGRPADAEKSEIGVRNTAIDGNNSRLKEGVKTCLETLLRRNGIGYDQVAAIYASGMITANVGLYEVPHLAAPAGRDDFVAAVKTVELPEVAPLPIHFIPGLKNMADGITADNVEGMDIMRGEEAEVIALLEWLPGGREYVFVLPGSHTKIVMVDKAGRMIGCLTSLAGEILDLLTNQSILADAVKHSFVSEGDFDAETMLAGFRIARETSLTRAAFTTRIMSQFVTRAPAAAANFLLGAVLEGDVAAVRGSRALRVSPDATVVVAGREPLRSALARVFGEDGFFREVRTFTAPDGMVSSAFGAYLVARARGALG